MNKESKRKVAMYGNDGIWLKDVGIIMRLKYTQESHQWTKHNLMHFLLEAMYLGFVYLFAFLLMINLSEHTDSRKIW